MRRGPWPGGHARWLSIYLVAGTVVFAVLDWLIHAPIRAAFLGRPGHRLMYYAALVGLGLLVRSRPHLGPVVGMAESAVNVFLVVLSIMLPVLALSDQVAAGGPIGTGLTTWGILGALFAGLVFVFSFHRSQHAMRTSSSQRSSP